MGFPIIDDMNGPMRAGAGYINMNIAADGSRVSSARAFLRPNLDRKNLTLLLNTNVTKVLFQGDRANAVEMVTGDTTRTVTATREVILARLAQYTALNSSCCLALEMKRNCADWESRAAWSQAR
jgi:choline dehydrogenase